MESLNILKVTDLKQILKQAGLTTTGTKSDLIQRIIQANLVQPSPSNFVAPSAQPQQVQQQAAKLEASLLVPDLKEIDEDAILGGDGFDDKSEDLAIPNEDLLLGESDSLSLSTPSIAKPTVKTVAPVPVASSAPQADDAKSKTSATKPAFVKPLAVNAEEKKQLRAAKFADPKKQSRAERFGLSTLPPAIVENHKILERANRFGEVVSEKAKTIEEVARIEKRKERFGEVQSDLKKARSITVAGGASSDQVLKRQERFGIVAASKANASLSAGNGRGRFRNFANKRF